MQIILYYYLGLSFLTALAFFMDKRFAEFDLRRIPEKWLHTLEFLGGWPGAWLASELFKHKRQKSTYMRVLYAAAIIHALAWFLYLLR